MIDKCPKCNLPLVKGTAILTDESTRSPCWFTKPLINAQTLKLIECLKCPSCGHSDDGK